MARVLVTGGAGFIGSHTVEALLRAGHTVTALDDLASGVWANLPPSPRLRTVTMDVRAAESLRALAVRERFAAIIHLAGWASVSASLRAPAEAHAVNVGGTLAVLETARLASVRRVVVASSAAVYGHCPPLPTPEDAPLRPASPYAAHKAAAELLCNAYRESFGLETVPLRYFNVYGQRQPVDSPYSGVVTTFVRCLRRGGPLVIHGDGCQTRDFVHVADVAAVNLRAALGPDPGPGAINVGSGTTTSIRALAELLRAVSGVQAKLVHGSVRRADVRHSHAAIDALRARLGYEPRVALADGLRALMRA